MISIPVRRLPRTTIAYNVKRVVRQVREAWRRGADTAEVALECSEQALPAHSVASADAACAAEINSEGRFKA